MIRLILLLVGVGLLVVGGEGLHDAARYRQQRFTTCERFVRGPDIAWVRLADRDVDDIGAGYRESGGRIVELLFLFLQTRRRRRREASALPTGPARAPGSLCGLMLLNLPPDAGAEAVEHAPPLGSRADVIRTLQAALPGIRIDESGRCTFERPDCTIEISLGPEEPLATALLNARGDSAIAVVRTMVCETGWRVFAPRRGTFIESEILGGPQART
jgi:hypothetical protein